MWKDPSRLLRKQVAWIQRAEEGSRGAEEPRPCLSLKEAQEAGPPSSSPLFLIHLSPRLLQPGVSISDPEGKHWAGMSILDDLCAERKTHSKNTSGVLNDHNTEY